MFRRPVASYAQHRVLSDASGSGSQRVGQTRDVRFFLGLEPHGEVGRDGVGTCAPAPCGDVGEPWSSLCPLHPGCSPGSGGARWVQMPPVGTGGGSGLAGRRLPRLRPHPTSRLRFRAPSSPPGSAREVCSGQGSRGPAVFSFSVPFGMTVPATEPLCFSEALL